MELILACKCLLFILEYLESPCHWPSFSFLLLLSLSFLVWLRATCSSMIWHSTVPTLSLLPWRAITIICGHICHFSNRISQVALYSIYKIPSSLPLLKHRHQPTASFLFVDSDMLEFFVVFAVAPCIVAYHPVEPTGCHSWQPCQAVMLFLCHDAIQGTCPCIHLRKIDLFPFTVDSCTIPEVFE